MKKSFSDVLKEFEAWLKLTGYVGTGSARSYARNYVPNILSKWIERGFLNIGTPNPYDCFNNNTANEKLRSYVMATSEQIILNLVRSGLKASTKKTLSNYRSGLRAFFEFMDEQKLFFDFSGWSSAEKDNLEVFVANCTVPISYSQTDLTKTFKSRLIAQDRAYDNMLYLARLMNRIFNNPANTIRKNQYDGLMESVINGIKFIIDSTGATIQFKDIVCVEIVPNKSVVVKVKGDKRYDIYSKDSYGKISLLKAITVADLSIDHDIPLENILNNTGAQSRYPKFKELSDYYACPLTNNYLSCRDIRKFNKKTKECFNRFNTQLVDPVFITGLYKDLEGLYINEISLTIMSRKANSSKGKNGSASKTTSSTQKKSAIKTPVVSTAKTAKTAQVSKTVPSSGVSIILHPGNISAFKNGLLKSKKAEVTLKYKDGRTDVRTWNASKFTPASDLMSNIRSHPWYRNGKANGLKQVELRIVP